MNTAQLLWNGAVKRLFRRTNSLEQFERSFRAIWDATPKTERPAIAETVIAVSSHYRHTGQVDFRNASSIACALAAVVSVRRFLQATGGRDRRVAHLTVVSVVGSLTLDDEFAVNLASAEVREFAEAFRSLLAEMSWQERLQLAEGVATRARIYCATEQWKDLKPSTSPKVTQVNVTAKALMESASLPRERAERFFELIWVLSRLVPHIACDRCFASGASDICETLGRWGHWIDCEPANAWDLGGEG